MHQKYLMVAVLLASLAGFVSVAESAQSADSTYTAKVRVFQEADITLYSGQYCYGSDNPEAIRASETGFSIFGTSKRVGMPLTADIDGPYNEFLIPAGKPMTVMLQWAAEKNGVKASCGPIGSTFYPQFGRNYDVTVGLSGRCGIQIRELFETISGKATSQIVPSSPSYGCLKN